MSIFVIGINHKTAPIALREQIYFSKDVLPLYLQDLLSHGHAEEAVLLSTCNRSELYCETNNIAAVCDWFCAQTTIARELLQPIMYVYEEIDAISHMMLVACGLDSMILGEPQILGQMKEAFSESCAASSVGPLFQRLFQQIFTLAKEIRTTTAIGACPVSVASAAVHFIMREPHVSRQSNVVVIGASDTTALLMRYLSSYIDTPITIVNRHIENAKPLAEAFGGHAADLHALPQLLLTADIVFSATGSPTPILTKNMVAEAISQRLSKPLKLIDVAVPRDMEPAIAELSRVNLYCIDDLKTIIEQNRQGCEHAAEKARDLIRKLSVEFVNESNALDKVTYTIRAYRGQIEEICQSELNKAKRQLKSGVDPDEVLDAFAHAFTKKLLHTPSVQLRQAGVEGRFELLRFAKQLFAIPDPEIERV